MFQIEICPWCKNKIKVKPGMRQPCPTCKELINVYPDKNSSVEYLQFIFNRRKEDLMDFQLAIVENLPVNQGMFNRLKRQANKLQKDLGE